MRKFLITSASFFFITFISMVAFADPVPLGLADIPVYPGAARDQAREKAAAANAKPYQAGPDYISAEVRLFSVSAATEDVLPWYLKKFGLSLAQEEGPGIDPADLSVKSKPGTVTRVTWALHAFQKDEHISGEGEGAGGKDSLLNSMDSARRMDKNYRTNRRQVNGSWVETAWLRWDYVDASKRLIRFEVAIDDANAEGAGNGPRTDIAFRARLFEAPALSVNEQKAQEKQAQLAADAKRNEQIKLDASNRQKALMASLPAGEPKPDFLEVPLYPGSAYYKDFADAYRKQGQAQFAWSTNDQPAQVAAFYEKALGKKPQPMGPNYSMDKLGRNRVTLMIWDNKFAKMGPGTTTIIISLSPLQGGAVAQAPAPAPAVGAAGKGGEVEASIISNQRAQSGDNLGQVGKDTGPTGQGMPADGGGAFGSQVDPGQDRGTPQRAAAAQAPAELVGTWVGSWNVNTVTYTYAFFTYNADNTYNFSGTFRESGSGVSGTFNGGGTFTVDQSACTYTTNGNYAQKPTDGPQQFFPWFTTNLAGPSTCGYSVNGGSLTVTQNINGAAMTIKLTRK
jgi:hypothetical protein